MFPSMAVSHVYFFVGGESKSIAKPDGEPWPDFPPGSATAYIHRSSCETRGNKVCDDGYVHKQIFACVRLGVHTFVHSGMLAFIRIELHAYMHTDMNRQSMNNWAYHWHPGSNVNPLMGLLSSI